MNLETEIPRLLITKCRICGDLEVLQFLLNFEVLIQAMVCFDALRLGANILQTAAALPREASLDKDNGI